MIALDTNIIVRFLVADDEQQHAASVRLLKGRTGIFIPDAVMLECAWVLASLYKVERGALVDALEAVAALPSVTLENAPRIRQALAWHRDGLDFADALHLAAAAGQCRSLATFDASFAKKAKGKTACKVGPPA